MIIPYKMFLVEDFCRRLSHYLNYRSSEQKATVTTIIPPYYFEPHKLLDKKQNVAVIVFNLFYFIFRLITSRRKDYDIVLLGGHLIAIPFLLVVKMLRFAKPRRKIIVTSFFIHSLGRSKIVQNVLGFLLSDESLLLIVQSPDEVEYYSHITDKAKIVLFPYCRGEITVKGNCGNDEEYIFAGGHTNRDYDCLLQAARKVNHYFLIICSRSTKLIQKPPNVRILNDVSPDDFYSYLNNSKIVIIPLREEIGSSGQMTSLTAMFFKKPIIYTNLVSVSQYFEDGVSGISYQKGNPDDLADKILYLLSRPDLLEQLGANAFKRYHENFHVSKYFEFLSDLIMQ